MTMAVSKWSWIVRLHNKEVLQINGDRLEVHPNGGLSFWQSHRDGEYMACYLPPDQVERCSIMGQASGHENGFVVLQEKPGEQRRPA